MDKLGTALATHTHTAITAYDEPDDLHIATKEQREKHAATLLRMVANALDIPIDVIVSEARTSNIDGFLTWLSFFDVHHGG